MKKLIVTLLIAFVVYVIYEMNAATVRLSIGAFRPVPPPNIITLVKGHKIATRSDGLHALVVGGNLPGDPSTTAWLKLWGSSEEDVRYLTIPGWVTFDLNDPTVDFVGTNRIVISSLLNGGPVRVNEFILNSNWTLTSDLLLSFGSTTNRAGIGVPLSDGGLMLAYPNQEPIGSGSGNVRFHIVYRPPPQAGDTTNIYAITNYLWDITPTGSELPTRPDMIQATNGLVYLWFIMDGRERIALSRFAVTNSAATLIDYESLWIDVAAVSGNLAINGENPRIVGASVNYSNKLFLAYQGKTAPFEGTNCDATVGSGFPVKKSPGTTILSINAADKTRVLEKSLDFDTYHGSQPYPVIWPKNNGIYFLVEYYDTNACTITWRQGLYQYSGGGVTYSNIGAGKVLAYATDGWVSFESNSIPTFFKMTFQ